MSSFFKRIFLLLILTTPLYAYLDPGTGSMLLYFIIGIFATMLYSIKSFFYKVKLFFLVLKGEKIEVDNGLDVVIYSEGGKYWSLFKPLIKELEKENIKVAYYTQDDNDEALNYKPNYNTGDNLIIKSFGSEIRATVAMNNLDAKVVIMTTPQLDVMRLVRSKTVRHYSHLIHAPTDALVYKKFAFDYFDSVMCSGPHQMDSIRELESVRGLPKKELFETGLLYYDTMLREIGDCKKESKDKKTILIAPTWGSNSMLAKFGFEFLKPLLNGEYNIIFRPHPQFYVSQKELITSIENRLLQYDSIVTIDKNPSGLCSMNSSDIMISDVSGIIFDYFFICKKPIILVGSVIDRGGLEAEDVSKDVWEESIFEKIATVVDEKSIDNIYTIVNSSLTNQNPKEIESFIDKYVYNFGDSASVAKSQIMNILEELNNDNN
jgi:hypothetical protein